MREALVTVKQFDEFLNGRSQDEGVTLEAAATALQVVRPLDAAFESIIEAILHAMDADAVMVRTKAIRSLGAVITSDMSLLTVVSLQTCPLASDLAHTSLHLPA